MKRDEAEALADFESALDGELDPLKWSKVEDSMKYQNGLAVYFATNGEVSILVGVSSSLAAVAFGVSHHKRDLTVELNCPLTKKAVRLARSFRYHVASRNVVRTIPVRVRAFEEALTDLLG